MADLSRPSAKKNPRAKNQKISDHELAPSGGGARTPTLGANPLSSNERGALQKPYGNLGSGPGNAKSPEIQNLQATVDQSFAQLQDNIKNIEQKVQQA